MGNKKEAENYSKLAIENAETIVHNLESKGAPAADIDKARRVLSDRKGNLAIIYLQQDRFSDAFDLLELLLAEDKKISYIRGLVVKQGTLGQFYLKQGEINSAEKVFKSALEFIRRKDEGLYNSEWNEDVRTSSQFACKYTSFYLLLLNYRKSEALSRLLYSIGQLCRRRRNLIDWSPTISMRSAELAPCTRPLQPRFCSR